MLVRWSTVSPVHLLSKRIGRRRATQLARSLAGGLASHEARALVYLRRGGQVPGQALADELGLPASGLDIRYPVSRLLDRAPAWARPALFAIKELAYRATHPRIDAVATDALPAPGTRLILFDDSASSGRTLRRALEILASAGIPREKIAVAVLRCGRRARGLVDHYAFE
jgi:adenine/guanine phosphoribosyltransferase-like PRPP-binding protein